MKNPRIYLDNCCFNRPFDDQIQIRIRLETMAKLSIQALVRDGYCDLTWSYMLDFENSKNPYEEKRKAIKAWKDLSACYCGSSQVILTKGKSYEKLGISPADALHIACAAVSGCEYFITTDVKLLKKQIKGIKIINPIDFIGEMEAGL